MKTVVFVSEKGGVGKTRLSDELYFYYMRQNVPVSLYSFDGQYKNRNNDKKVDNPEVAVVDTPGRLMDDKTIQTIQGADVVVIPTRPTGGNIEAFTRTVALVKENADCPIIIAVNGVNRFTASAKEAELRREEARPVIELVNNELINSEDVLEKMSAYSKDEARVIAKHIVMNMDRIIHGSQDEIIALREKKKNVLNVEKPCKSRSVIRSIPVIH